MNLPLPRSRPRTPEYSYTQPYVLVNGVRHAIALSDASAPAAGQRKVIVVDPTTNKRRLQLVPFHKIKKARVTRNPCGSVLIQYPDEFACPATFLPNSGSCSTVKRSSPPGKSTSCVACKEGFRLAAKSPRR
jgi:hypothetical protein